MTEPRPQRQVRVFISSTFRDTHAERGHLGTVVFPELVLGARAPLPATRPGEMTQGRRDGGMNRIPPSLQECHLRVSNRPCRRHSGARAAPKSALCHPERSEGSPLTVGGNSSG